MNMRNFTIAGYRFSLMNLLLVGWLILLTSITAVNLGISAQNPESAEVKDLDSRLQQLLAQVTVHSERFDGLLQEPTITQSQLTNVQQALMQRIQAVTEQFRLFVTKNELTALQKQLSANQERISKIEANITALTTQLNALNPPQPKVQTTKRVTVNPSPPFKVLGAELRGGEQILVIQPNGKTAIDSLQLVSIGQSYANWQLQSFNRQSAEFRQGNKVRRITISR